MHTVLRNLARTLVPALIVFGVLPRAHGPLAPAAAAAWAEGTSAMIDVGGFHLSVYCEGSGSPTVLMDGGYGDELAEWDDIQPSVAATTRVCAFDRPGIFPSEARPHHAWTTAQSTVHDMHVILTALHARTPLVLVGHSIGGIDVRLYAARYRTDVGGMVLVDPAHEQQCRWSLCTLPPGERYNLRTSFAEMRAANLGSIRGTLGSIPLVVVSRGLYPPVDPHVAIWRSLQRQIAGASSNSMQVVATQSGDDIPENQPDVVTRAVSLVVGAVRHSSHRLPMCPSAFGRQYGVACAAK